MAAQRNDNELEGNFGTIGVMHSQGLFCIAAAKRWQGDVEVSSLNENAIVSSSSAAQGFSCAEEEEGVISRHSARMMSGQQSKPRKVSQ
jgi:hypothetical protein